MTKPQVGQWVRDQMHAQKIGVKVAAERSGLSRQTWYDLTKDRHPPSTDTQRGVAKALGVASDWYDRLLAGDDPIVEGDPTVSPSRSADVLARFDSVDGRLDSIDATLQGLLRRAAEMVALLGDSLATGSTTGTDESPGRDRQGTSTRPDH